MGGRGEPPDTVTGDAVAEVRAVLRRRASGDRADALERLRRWFGAPLEPEALPVVLRAAVAVYPTVGGESDEPGALFARLLWTRPRELPVSEVEAAYLVGGEKVRRSLLRLLALRRDVAGLDAVAFLIGPDGPTDLLPVPSVDLLDPLLELPEAPRLAPALVSSLTRRGWAPHAARLLRRMVLENRLDPEEQDRLVAAVAVLVGSLVDTCDRAVLVRPARQDPTRVDRGRLAAVLTLARVLPGPVTTRVLHRGLASADPRVGALAALGLVDRGVTVPDERWLLIARDPEARGQLDRGLADLGREELLPAPFATAEALAEADLVRWLCHESELGAAPDEIEHAGAVSLGDRPDDGEAHLFRFRIRAPHWSCARGWMIGASGPFRVDGGRGGTLMAFAYSLYAAEDDASPVAHLEAILHDLAVWPDSSGEAA